MLIRKNSTNKIVGELKNVNDINSDGAESMFFLTILGKIKETKSRKFNSIIKDSKLSSSEI